MPPRKEQHAIPAVVMIYCSQMLPISGLFDHVLSRKVLFNAADQGD